MTQQPPTRSILTTSEGVNREAFSPADWALFMAISLLWGSSFMLMAIGLEAFEPGVITLLRVGLGAAALWLVPRARATRVAAEDWPRLVALSFLWVAIPFSLFPLAQQYINSATAGMLNGAVPIFAAVVAAFMLRRLPGPATLLGLALGFLGVVAISAPSMGEGSAEAFGVLLIVLATVCYGFSVNIAAPIQQRYGSIPVMARMLGLATIWTAPLGAVAMRGSTFAWGSFLAVAAAGVLGTGLAFVIMGSLVGRVGSTRASFITYVIPVVALVLGVVFLGDEVGRLALVGVAMVIAGAFLASRRD
ncbi:MAG TPA: DMT family transporter [Acidimicrobiia bacterium]|jgi:drug/metabolite transporter (DMT)-like permease|nr:DMT family transporter [Acidimicrobiia bacterium]